MYADLFQFIVALPVKSRTISLFQDVGAVLEENWQYRLFGLCNANNV